MTKAAKDHTESLHKECKAKEGLASRNRGSNGADTETLSDLSPLLRKNNSCRVCHVGKHYDSERTHSV